MEKTPQIKKNQGSLSRRFGAFVRQFHLLIFFVAMVLALAGAVIFINQALTEQPKDNYTSAIDAGSIDQATLRKVQTLHTSKNPAPAPALPGGRVNPFSE